MKVYTKIDDDLIEQCCREKRFANLGDAYAVEHIADDRSIKRDETVAHVGVHCFDHSA